MRNLSIVALAVLTLVACGSTQAAPAGPAPVVELQGVATSKAAGGVCGGSWMRFSHPGELPAESDPWTVYFVAEGHDPAALVYTVRIMWVEGTASQHPQVVVGPGPGSRPTVKTVGNCFGCTQMIARVKATTPQDCSELTVLYPFDHSNGQ